MYSVDDRVILLKDIVEGPDDYSPGGTLAKEGEELVVREIRERDKEFPIMISHPQSTTSSFCVALSEIKLKEENV